jgi:hypothetical protein
MASASQAAAKPELGVLFVHGIGQQHQGQTLVQFGDPISRWLVRWLTRGDSKEAAVGAAEEAPLWLEKTALGGDAPAHLLMTIDRGDDLSLPRRQRWLLAESWWAETFQPPRATSLLLWILLILPYVSLSQFYGQVLRALRRPSRPDWYRQLARGLRGLVYLFFYICALPLAAAVALLVALLIVAMLIPIPAISDRAKQVAVLLSNTLGDSYVLARSSVQFDAMVTRVAGDLDWLAKRADRVVVLAHSQGTSVAYVALAAKERPGNVSAFVTVGTSIKKLQLMRTLQTFGAPREPLPQLSAAEVRESVGVGLGRWLRLKSTRFGFAWLGLVGVYVVAYAVPQLVVATPAHGKGFAAGLLLVGLLAVIGPLLICHFFWRDDFRAEPRPLGPDHGRLHWADFYASADPVPSGPLFSDVAAKPWLVEKEVWNLGSVIRDHTSYTSSEDDFLGYVVGELVGATGRSLPDETKAALARARWRGWWRVWCLTLVRVLAAVTAIVTVYRASSHLTQIGNRVAHWPHWWSPVKWIGKQAIAGLQKLLAPVVDATNEQVVGALTLVLVAVAGYVLLAAVWAYWQRQDVQRFYRRRPPERDTDPLGGRELLLFLFTLLLEGAIAISIGLERDYDAVWNWSSDHKAFVVAIVVVGLGVAPVMLAWLLRPLLRRLERYLMRTFPRDPAEPHEAADAVSSSTAVAPPIRPL